MKFGKLIRMNEWLFSKLPFMFLPILCCFTELEHITVICLCYFLYLFFFYSFGYAINDYSDRAADKMIGKQNIMGALSEVQCVLILVFLVSGALPLAIISKNRSIYAVLLWVYFWGAAYSIRPFRFKERGVSGLIVCTLAQRTFPMLPLLSISTKMLKYVVVWGTIGALVGLRYILIHQVIDLENDRKTGTATFALSHLNKAKKMLYICFVIETLLVVSFLFLEYNVFISVGICTTYLIVMAITFYTIHYIFNESYLESYIAVPYEDLYNFYYPIVLLLIALKQRTIAFFVLLIIVIIGIRPMTDKWKIMNFGIMRIWKGFIWKK